MISETMIPYVRINMMISQNTSKTKTQQTTTKSSDNCRPPKQNTGNSFLNQNTTALRFLMILQKWNWKKNENFLYSPYSPPLDKFLTFYPVLKKKWFISNKLW